MKGDLCFGCEATRKKLSNLKEEYHYLEHKVHNLDGDLENLMVENHQLTQNVAELSEYVQDLETALAEAHLMSQPDPKATS